MGSLERLRSRRRNEILDELSLLSAGKEFPPPEPVENEVVGLLHHSDADIREAAIVTACTHWMLDSAVPALLRMVEGGENDQVVLESAARAAGSVGRQRPRVRPRVVPLLAKLALDENRDPGLRGVAYIAARWAEGLLTAPQYAEATEDIEELDVEWDWLRRHAGGTGGEQTS